MKLDIELDQRHIDLCRKFASMRRTLEEAQRLLYNEVNDGNANEAAFTADELGQITPTIEALQHAVRYATLKSGRVKQ